MLIICCFGSLSKLYSQDTSFILPVKEKILLSGSFGELRSTHLHSGMDIKTGQKIGIPVYAIKDGIVSRVSISGTGYGNCLYIAYKDGHTSVYGHLSKFIPRIDSILNILHYKKLSFKLDVDFRKYNIKVKQGDLVAWSGDSGSSGGPHVHFEIRDTKTSYALNPLIFYKIHDNIAPNILGLYLYNISDEGCNKLYKEIKPTKLSNNKYIIEDTIPQGKYGMAFHIEDKMPNSHNKLGVRTIFINRIDSTKLNDMLFSMNMDSISFYQTKYINAIKDFNAYKDGKTVYKCFGKYQNDVIGFDNNKLGIFSILDSNRLEYNMKVTDYSGNMSNISLTFVGFSKINKDLVDNNNEFLPDSINKSLKYIISKPSVDSTSQLLKMGKYYKLISNGFSLELRRRSLFNNFRIKLCIDTINISSLSMNTNIISKKISNIPYKTILYATSNYEVPLLQAAKIKIDGDFMSKDLICEVDKRGRIFALKSNLISEGISASTNYLSKYIVLTDTIAPYIRYEGYNSKKSAFIFKVEDGISGIKDFRATINGKWVLLFYDPKTLSLYCRESEPALINKKEVPMCLKVWDNVGNMSTISVVLRKTDKK